MKLENLWKNLNYIILISLIVGQCVVKVDFLIGQFIYLGANLLSFSRCFILKRPAADKVKDGCCTGITLGLILLTII